jgi:hypothetical protein
MKSNKLFVIAALFLILIFVISAIFILFSYFNRAYLVRVINLSSTSFVVTWHTDISTLGKITIKDSEGNLVGEIGKFNELTENRLPTTDGKFLTHYVVVNDLKPDTEYTFDIETTPLQPFKLSFVNDYTITETSTVKTLTISENPPIPMPLYGQLSNSIKSADIFIIQPRGYSPIGGVTNNKNFYIDMSTSFSVNGDFFKANNGKFIGDTVYLSNEGLKEVLNGKEYSLY